MRSLFLVAGVVSPGVAFTDADPARSPGFVQIDRYDLGVSTPLLDDLCLHARALSAHGAKLTGAGVVVR